MKKMIKFNKDSNIYTVIFAVILVFLVGFFLVCVSEFLKPIINQNIILEKKQSLLNCLGIKNKFESIDRLYKKHIIKELAINYKGEIILEGKQAFNIDLIKEIKRPLKDQYFPLYIAKNEKNEKLHIIPLIGEGLWDIIWGYVSLDKNLIIKGISLDHKGETPGLGAEITKDYFQSNFIGEKILNKKNIFVGIDIIKNNNDPKNKNKSDNKIDAISGATITSNGVSNMIKNRLILYISYLNKKLL